MKKPPLVRKSAEKWLTILNYGQIWNSGTDPTKCEGGFILFAQFSVSVVDFPRFGLWPLWTFYT